VLLHGHFSPSLSSPTRDPLYGCLSSTDPPSHRSPATTSFRATLGQFDGQSKLRDQRRDSQLKVGPSALSSHPRIPLRQHKLPLLHSNDWPLRISAQSLLCEHPSISNKQSIPPSIAQIDAAQLSAMATMSDPSHGIHRDLVRLNSSLPPLDLRADFSASSCRMCIFSQHFDTRKSHESRCKKLPRCS
jgi:hypothetical protein